jgi:hypothetical protein
VGQLPVTHFNYAQTNLELSVGYATGFTGGGQSTYGINFVESFRGENGRSATQTNTPVIVIPPTLVNAGDNIVITTLPPNGNGGSPNQIIQAIPGPAYGAGFGAPVSTQVVANAGGLGFAVGMGGPPAFPAYQNPLMPNSGAYILYSEGYAAIYPLTTPVGTGIDAATAMKYFPGTYKLNVYNPNVPNPGSINAPGSSNYSVVSASAVLKGTPLPPMSQATLAFDGKGGGTITAIIPAGVTETYLTISGYACAEPGTYTTPVTFNTELIAPAVYTFLSEVPGPATVNIPVPDQIGPIGTTTNQAFRTICLQSDLAALNASAGFQAFVQAVGFDYPAYESVYPNNFGRLPLLSGPSGQSDITFSQTNTYRVP